MNEEREWAIGGWITAMEEAADKWGTRLDDLNEGLLSDDMPPWLMDGIDRELLPVTREGYVDFGAI